MEESRIGIRRWAARAAAAAFILSGAAGAAEDYSQWAHSADVFLNTLPDGANVTGEVRNFPVLIRLDGSVFDFAQARGKGQDVRFAKADGTRLAYQIERWDSAGAAADLWVRVDTVFGNSMDQGFKMLWGNASAADSSKGAAVFDTAQGYAAVWHLGGAAAAARANSVAQGLAAAPKNYDGDESRPGVTGLCDSLDGTAAGDYLDLGAGYADFTGGFTYSVWANPSVAGSYAKLLDIGNGAGIDNIALFRVATGADLSFKNWSGVDTSRRVTAPGALALNEWQHIVLAVSGKQARIYRNGALVAADTIAVTLANVARTKNYIGRSNWVSNAYYTGKIDEPWISRTERSADWVRLCYANQKPGQTFASFVKPLQCTSRFGAPKDTAIIEGSRVQLDGTADCATGYSWSLVSGPGGVILDPSVKSLQIYLPRITHDTSVVYRFTAHFDSDRTQDVRIAIKEAIPDPVFTLPAAMDWNGGDTLTLKPDITNLAAIRASRDSTLFYSWELNGVAADTAWLSDGLRLDKCSGQGSLDVTLCLGNGGPPACHSTHVTVGAATGVRKRPAPAPAGEAAARRDLRGRWLDGRGKRAGYSVPAGAVTKD
jgi:hypothetical protein